MGRGESHVTTWGKAFQAEDMARAKALRQNHAFMLEKQHRG